MPTPMKSSHNLHSVWGSGQPLGVGCKGCGRRALAFADRIDDFRGNMRELRTLRFKCSACGSVHWDGWLFVQRYGARRLARGAGRVPGRREPADVLTVGGVRIAPPFSPAAVRLTEPPCATATSPALAAASAIWCAWSKVMPSPFATVTSKRPCSSRPLVRV